MKLSNLALFLSIILLSNCNNSDRNADQSDLIRFNQLGYYPSSIKQFMFINHEGENFEIIDGNENAVFSGKLENNGLWETSGDTVMMGTFTEFSDPGTYYILVDDSLKTDLFQIKNNLYFDAENAAIKSFYFQRASMAIEETYGDIYKRAAGHPDDSCLFHPSSGKSSGYLNSPGGWYDAGDYGKYIVNAALSTAQMLHLLEQYPDAIPDGTLNIPESGNGKSDLWDELKYELDWMLTMQDSDGGVFFKLTAKNFGDFIMPEAYDLDRYIIGKSTTSSLSFAAVMAQAARWSYSKDPEWSAKALQASENAWNWAYTFDDIVFKNPEAVSTGQYGDDKLYDDFYWAASELFITTGDDMYKEMLLLNHQAYQHQLTNSWKYFVRNNAFHSMLNNPDNIDDEYALQLKVDHLILADSLLESIQNNPYRVALELYEWGSNSDVLNQAMILCFAHRVSGNEKYLNGAEQLTDYIFGKNATGYSFVTGYGTKQVMFPHHRPSGADSITLPVPGLIVGGPNKDRQDAHQVTYISDYPAKSFMDVEPSFASNEVCINWNAPLVYVLGYIDQVKSAR